MDAQVVDAMLAVGDALAAGGTLRETLDVIAYETTRVVPGSRAASVYLVRGRGRFDYGGMYGLSPGYRRMLLQHPLDIRPGQGPAGVAVQTREIVLVEDTETDERVVAWRALARWEGFRALATIPLCATDMVVGSLNVYRDPPGPWRPRQLRLLDFFAQHAVKAVQTAQLIDRQSKEVDALARLVRGLHEQMHEHRNRLHAINGLLALGKVDVAREFIAGLQHEQEGASERVNPRLRHATLAGFVLAEIALALQRGITLELDTDSAIERLPAPLSDAQALTVVGNLLDNAFDAVAEMPPPRRRVRLRIADEGDETVIAVRDWGEGIASEIRHDLFRTGSTTKPDGHGLGLPLVCEVAQVALGHVDVHDCDPGTMFEVRIPNG